MYCEPSLEPSRGGKSIEGQNQVRNMAKKPEKPKFEVFEPKARNRAKKPEKPKLEVFGSKTSNFGFSGFLTIFLA